MTKTKKAKPANKPAAKKAPAKKTAAKKPAAKKATDKITSVKGTTSGGDAVCVSNGKTTLTYPPAIETAKLRKLAVVGGSMKALDAYLAEHKPKIAALAKGAEGELESKMAAAKSRKTHGGRPARKGTKAATGKKSTVKRVSQDEDRTYTKGDKENTSRETTWTHYMLAVIQRNKSTQKAIAAHAKTGEYADKKLDFKWAADKDYIRFA